MAEKFIWDLSKTQSYTKENGSQKLSPYDHDSIGPFWKDSGTNFTMDAENEYLYLIVEGNLGDNNTIDWPSKDSSGIGNNIKISNGALIIDFNHNTSPVAGANLGVSAPLFLTIENSGRLEFLSCPTVVFGDKNCTFNMSGDSRFNIDGSGRNSVSDFTIISGDFKLKDNAFFSIKLPENNKQAVTYPLIATLTGNAKMEFRDDSNSESRFIFDQNTQFEINGDTPKLHFMSKAKPFFSIDTIAQMKQGTFNFTTSTKNDGEIFIQNVGKNELNAFCKTGSIAINGQPQYDDKNVNYSFDSGLQGLRISIKN